MRQHTSGERERLALAAPPSAAAPCAKAAYTSSLRPHTLVA
jgi:hypothetical protein